MDRVVESLRVKESKIAAIRVRSCGFAVRARDRSLTHRAPRVYPAPSGARCCNCTQSAMLKVKWCDGLAPTRKVAPEVVRGDLFGYATVSCMKCQRANRRAAAAASAKLVGDTTKVRWYVEPAL